MNRKKGNYMQSTASITHSLQASVQGKHLIKIFFKFNSFLRRRKTIDDWYILGSDTEETNRESLRNIRSDSNISQSILGTPASVIEDDDDDYESQADEIIEKVWRIFKDDDSWIQEAKSSDGLDIVIAKSFPKWGKVFRLSVKKTN
jgi:hypothetical protein